MNSEKINLNKRNNKLKEKSNTNTRYTHFKISKSFNEKNNKVGNDLNFKYSISNNLRHKNINNKQILVIKNIIYYLIIFFLPVISMSKRIATELRTLNSYQEITIKVKEGKQKIINDNFNPDEILLNGNSIAQTYKNNGNVINIYENDTTINLKWNNKLLTCADMFKGLDNIISIDFSNFDFSLVESLAGLCFGCLNLKYVNFGSSETSSLKEINFIFASCHSLISLNLSNFNTKKVTNMGAAFSDCTSLISIDLSSFDTSLVEDFSFLFCNCSSLQSLDIYTFNTQSAINMLSMFTNCTSLQSLELGNFNTEKVLLMISMFENCQSLISLNIDKFNTKGIDNMSKMFYNCTSLISLDLSSFDISKVNNIENMFDNCNSLIFLNLKSFKEGYKYTTHPFLKISKDLVYCIDEVNSPIIAFELELQGLIKNCSDICFLDTKIIDVEKRKCIFYCENSEICKYENKDICCDRCPEGTKPKNNICEIETTDLITELIPEENETINCTSKMFFKKICGTNSTSEQDNIINNIKNDIETHEIDELLANVTNANGKNHDIIVKERGTTYQITSSDNQNNENYEDLATIKLGECEEKLKEKYHIDKNQSLIIFKIEHNVPGILIPIISYEIYHPKNKSKLELDECKDILVDLDIPVNINGDDIVKYDPESEYYTDECYPYTTENGTDIIINDRIDEYNNNNMSLCEKNCEFNGYEENTKKAQCKCKTKSKVDNISEISQSNNLLLETNFEKENGTLNIVTMKCTYTLFSKNGIIKNIGNYILLFIIIFFLISTILFFKVGPHIFETYIKSILNLKSQNGGNSKRIKKKINIKKKKKAKSSKNVLQSNPIKKQKKINEKAHKHIEIFKPNISKSNSKTDLKNSNELKTSKKYILTEKNKNEKLNTFQNKVKSNLEYEELNIYELNTLSYQSALKYDKRTFFEYYISLIRTNNIIIFAFCPLNDYNIRIIKICLLLIFFVIHYTINTLFFTKALIHEIYKNGGAYNYSSVFPKIIGSFLISYFLCSIIKYLSLSDKLIIEIKFQTTYEEAEEKAEKVKRIFIIQNICFFILGFIFLIFFWYYLSSFCAVYQNSQIYLLKNVLLSFSLSLLFPFILYVVPSILRIISLKSRKMKIIYIISRFIQFI